MTEICPFPWFPFFPSFPSFPFRYSAAIMTLDALMTA